MKIHQGIVMSTVNKSSATIGSEFFKLQQVLIFVRRYIYIYIALLTIERLPVIQRVTSR